MIQELSAEIEVEGYWTNFKNMMKSYIKPAQLEQCKVMSHVCDKLLNLGKIYHGNYDVLSAAFDDINHHVCYDIVKHFTDAIKSEQDFTHQEEYSQSRHALKRLANRGKCNLNEV